MNFFTTRISKNAFSLAVTFQWTISILLRPLVRFHIACSFENAENESVIATKFKGCPRVASKSSRFLKLVEPMYSRDIRNVQSFLNLSPNTKV